MVPRTEKTPAETAPGTGGKFPRMLTLEQVKEILNVGTPTLYALLRSGDLRGVQIGGRGIWRISEDDLAAYLEQAYKDTQDRLASGQVTPVDAAVDD